MFEEGESCGKKIKVGKKMIFSLPGVLE